jgi:hypothetical protein
MKKFFPYSMLQLSICLVFLVNISCVTGKSSTAKAKHHSDKNSASGNSIGRGLEISHAESMAQKLKSEINMRIKNIGACKDGTQFDMLADKTNLNIDIKKIHDIIAKGLIETPLKIVPKGSCVMRGSMSHSETKSGSSSVITYYLTATITNQNQEIVWSHKQDLKIKM